MNRTLSWLDLLTAQIEVAPEFLAALDTQLRSHAQRLIGVDLANGSFALVPPDDGFRVQFVTMGAEVFGVIQGFLVDPVAHGHPVSFSWRATGAADRPIPLDQERDDLEIFWSQFPVTELSAVKPLDVGDAAAAVTAAFPVEWHVFTWERLCLTVEAQRAFSDEEVATLTAALAQAVREWNTDEDVAFDYVGEPEIADAGTRVRYRVDASVAGVDGMVALINALGKTTAAPAIARCTVRLS